MVLGECKKGGTVHVIVKCKNVVGRERIGIRLGRGCVTVDVNEELKLL